MNVPWNFGFLTLKKSIQISLEWYVTQQEIPIEKFELKRSLNMIIACGGIRFDFLTHKYGDTAGFLIIITHGAKQPLPSWNCHRFGNTSLFLGSSGFYQQRQCYYRARWGSNCIVTAFLSSREVSISDRTVLVQTFEKINRTTAAVKNASTDSKVRITL